MTDYLMITERPNPFGGRKHKEELETLGKESEVNTVNLCDGNDRLKKTKKPFSKLDICMHYLLPPSLSHKTLPYKPFFLK